MADVVFEAMAKAGIAAIPIGRLVFAVASKLDPQMPRRAREWRLFKTLINHDFLMRVIGVEAAREVYSDVETLVHWDYHYWLQRGGLELEAGDICLAENFLGQAFSLGGDDPLVKTEYGYLQIRLGVESPTGPDAGTRVAEGIAMLEEMIKLRGRYDPYPYHVLGSQGLAWSRRATLPARERRLLLERLIRHVDEGRGYHVKVLELKQLQEDLKRELLMMAVDVKAGG